MRRLLGQVPLRWQLAVLYVACLGLVLSLLGLILFAEVDRILVDNTYSQLSAVGDRALSAGDLQGIAATASPVFPFSVPWMHVSSTTTPCTVRRSCAPVPQATALPEAALPAPTGNAVPLDQYATNGVVLRFVQIDGVMQSQAGVSRLLDQVPLPTAAQAAAAVATGRSLQYTIGNPTARYAVLLRPAAVKGGGQGVLQLATSLQPVDGFLLLFRDSLMVGVLMAVGSGAIVGLVVTRRLLRPLDRMAQVSRTVAEGDLSRRFKGPAGSREVTTLARSFNYMIDRLEASLRSQQRFTADAAHELRTPLTALGGSVEILLLGADEGDQERVQKVLRTMDLEIQRLTRLVNDLLQLSRADGRMALQVETVDVNALAAEVAAELQLVGPHVTVAYQGDGELPVVGDRDKLKQVFLNVGHNAVKFTPKGGRVVISALRIGNLARVRISDNGPGIPAADLPRIFDRFYRSDVSRARSSGGLGLGLAIAKAIVDAHGGTIVAASPPGQGATFTVDLPIVVASEMGVGRNGAIKGYPQALVASNSSRGLKPTA